MPSPPSPTAAQVAAARQCSATIFGPRVTSWACCKNATVEREGKWYCGTHDPERVKARTEKRDCADRQRRTLDNEREQEAEARCRALGFGFPHWSSHTHSHTGGLVLPAEEADKLITALAEREAAVRAEWEAMLRPLARFIERFDAKPIANLADAFYGIHAGTEWEAELKLSDLRKIAAALREAPRG